MTRILFYVKMQHISVVIFFLSMPTLITFFGELFSRHFEYRQRKFSWKCAKFNQAHRVWTRLMRQVSLLQSHLITSMIIRAIGAAMSMLTIFHNGSRLNFAGLFERSCLVWSVSCYLPLTAPGQKRLALSPLLSSGTMTYQLWGHAHTMLQDLGFFTPFPLHYNLLHLDNPPLNLTL